MGLFVVPAYTCKYTIFPHYNTIHQMYDAINSHDCTQEEWYVYIDFVTNHDLA